MNWGLTFENFIWCWLIFSAYVHTIVLLHNKFLFLLLPDVYLLYLSVEKICLGILLKLMFLFIIHSTHTTSLDCKITFLEIIIVHSF